MKTNQTNEIKRLHGGSIDYAHYAASAARTRHEEIKSLVASLPSLAPRPATIARLFGLVIIAPLILR